MYRDYILEPNVQIDKDKLEIEEKEYRSLYDLVIENSINKSVVLIDGFPVYMQDIRANYRDGELYFLVYKYDTIDKDGIAVRYNNRIEKKVIHTFKDGFLINELIIIPNTIFNRAYKVNLNNIKLSRDLSDKDKEALDLFNRYVASSYGVIGEDVNLLLDYNIIAKWYLTNTERRILERNKLKFMDEVYKGDYRDVRRWKLEDLRRNVGEQVLQLDKSYKLRRLEFELELYTRLYDKEYWINWTHGNWDEFISNNKQEYIKYKEVEIYLIFKKRWIIRE